MDSSTALSTGGPPALNAGGFVCFINNMRFVLPETIQGVRGISYVRMTSFSKQFMEDNEHHDIQTMTPELLKEAYRIYVNLRFPDDTVQARNNALARVSLLSRAQGPSRNVPTDLE